MRIRGRVAEESDHIQGQADVMLEEKDMQDYHVHRYRTHTAKP